MTETATASMPDARPRRRARWLFPLLGGLFGFAAVLAFKAFDARERSYLAERPPEFPAGGTWINAQRPLNIAELRGNVVLVQFSFVGCVFCRKMDPYLSKWREQYGADGLTIIEVDDGNIDALEKVRAWAARDTIPYPVYYDAGGAMTKRYGVNSYPKRILVGRDGNVVWEGGGWRGEEGVAQEEDVIRQALGK